MRFDFLFIGGGLQNVLGALAVLDRRPELSVCVIESELQIGGNHTWCFHSSDVPASLVAVVEPLVSVRWSKWRVEFPDLVRTFDKPYAMVTSGSASAAMHRAFDRHPNRVLRLGTKVS
ncbi:MAG: lycopene cyclase family protein, partial [Polyangiaceae bacterium]